MSKQLINLKLVELNVPVKKRDGGTYYATQITYDTESGGPYTKAVASVVLEKNPELRRQFETLASITPTAAVLETEKNGQFTNVVSLRVASEGDVSDTTDARDTTAQHRQNSGTTSAGPSSKTFSHQREHVSSTKEENIRIAVALKAAVEYAGNSSTEFSVSQVVEIAKEFDTYLRGEER